MPAPAPIPPTASSSSTTLDELKASPIAAALDGPDPASLSIDAIRESLESIIVSSESSKATFRNWAKTYECRPAVVFEPSTVHECRLIVELALREGQTVHPVGVGHSPSDLACTRGFMVKMEGLKGMVSIDIKTHRATFLAGTTLHDIHAELQAHHLALPNIGSISDQTIGGLISTASHGTGVNYPVLSEHCKSILLIQPISNAPLLHASTTENQDLFKASLCGLGATGLMVHLEMEVEPSFRLEETKEGRPFEEVMNELDTIKKSAQHVRLWWYPHSGGVVVGRANRTYASPKPHGSWMDKFLGYHVTQAMLFVSRYIPAFTSVVGKWVWYLSKGPSLVVDHGFKVLNFDCLFPQYTMEWALPATAAAPALYELRLLLDKEQNTCHFPIEVRWSREDDIWLSPSYGRETVWIGIVTYRPYGLPVTYRNLFESFSGIMERHGGRPHWAKQHSQGPKELAQLYPKFNDFVSLIKDNDPQAILRSEYTRRHIFGEVGEDVDARTFKKSWKKEGEVKL